MGAVDPQHPLAPLVTSKKLLLCLQTLTSHVRVRWLTHSRMLPWLSRATATLLSCITLPWHLEDFSFPLGNENLRSFINLTKGAEILSPAGQTKHLALSNKLQPRANHIPTLHRRA